MLIKLLRLRFNLAFGAPVAEPSWDCPATASLLSACDTLSTEQLVSLHRE